MTDSREAKLPRWAQHELAKERQRASKAESRLAAHLQTVEKTRIWYGDYQSPIYVPPNYGHQRVHFDLAGEGHAWDEVQVGLTESQDALIINGGRTCLLEMHASNHFFLRLGN